MFVFVVYPDINFYFLLDYREAVTLKNVFCLMLEELRQLKNVQNNPEQFKSFMYI